MEWLQLWWEHYQQGIQLGNPGAYGGVAPSSGNNSIFPVNNAGAVNNSGLQFGFPYGYGAPSYGNTLLSPSNYAGAVNNSGLSPGGVAVPPSKNSSNQSSVYPSVNPYLISYNNTLLRLSQQQMLQNIQVSSSHQQKGNPFIAASTGKDGATSNKRKFNSGGSTSAGPAHQQLSLGVGARSDNKRTKFQPTSSVSVSSNEITHSHSSLEDILILKIRETVKKIGLSGGYHQFIPALTGHSSANTVTAKESSQFDMFQEFVRFLQSPSADISYPFQSREFPSNPSNSNSIPVAGDKASPKELELSLQQTLDSYMYMSQQVMSSNIPMPKILPLPEQALQTEDLWRVHEAFKQRLQYIDDCDIQLKGLNGEKVPLELPTTSNENLTAPVSNQLDMNMICHDEQTCQQPKRRRTQCVGDRQTSPYEEMVSATTTHQNQQQPAYNFPGQLPISSTIQVTTSNGEPFCLQPINTTQSRNTKGIDRSGQSSN